MFKMKPMKEILAMTQQAIDETLAPFRARSIKAKAELELAKLDEELITLERAIHEECAKKEINFDAIITKMDKYELLERRRKQLAGVVDALFPTKD